MEIQKNLEIMDLCLKYKNTLIIGDLQFGYEEYLNKKGVMIPRFQTEDAIERIKNTISKCRDLKRIVLNGDIKHEFGRISKQEWSSITRLIDGLIKDYEVVIVKGNHDVMLEPIIRNYGEKISFVEKFVLDDLFIVHGDKIFECNEKTIIIGHEHPSISFVEKPGEKFKCFLKGKWKRKNLIVIPSFSSLAVGSDIKHGKFLSPYLEKGIGNFEVFIVEDKTYNFGKFKNLEI